MNPLRPCTLLGFALLGLAASSSLLLAADEGKGSFQFGKATFQISNAMAYQKDGKDPKKPVTMVIVADFKIDQQALMEAIDPANALMTQVAKNQGGNFVMVTLASPDRCGVWAFLDTGKQIDLGDSFPAKTTTTSATRIAGECSTSKPEKTLFGDAYDFHLAYDVPVTAIPKASPVPAGGGEPGHALIGSDQGDPGRRLGRRTPPSSRGGGSENGAEGLRDETLLRRARAQLPEVGHGDGWADQE